MRINYIILHVKQSTNSCLYIIYMCRKIFARQENYSCEMSYEDAPHAEMPHDIAACGIEEAKTALSSNLPSVSNRLSPIIP